MDEYTSGMEPQVRRYFKRIVKSISAGAFWFMTLVLLGLSLRLAIVKDGWRWYNYAFYAYLFLSLCFMVYYQVKLWRAAPDS